MQKRLAKEIADKSGIHYSKADKKVKATVLKK